jgi:hypothetical protein
VSTKAVFFKFLVLGGLWGAAALQPPLRFGCVNDGPCLQVDLTGSSLFPLLSETGVFDRLCFQRVGQNTDFYVNDRVDF